MRKNKSDNAVYMRQYRKNNMTPQEKALLLLRLFTKKIRNGQFDVETASWWQGMGMSATLRIDVSAPSYEEYEDLDNS